MHRTKSLLLLIFLYHLPLVVLLGILYQQEVSLFIFWSSYALGELIVLAFALKLFQNYARLIEATANKIKAGEHETRLRLSGIKEFDALRNSLNPMLDSLDTAIKHLAVHREELRLIVNSIEEVLWAQSLDGKIEWVNDSFSNLFETYDPFQSQYYWEVFLQPRLSSLVKDYSTGNPEKLNELEINGSYYLLSGSKNSKAGRIVFILYNIDRIRQAEQMKKDFIVNLAHEIRTPLTAIKGFSEAMEQTAKPENIRFLKIIQNHTERLIHLVNDLQILIKLERQNSLDLQEINLHTFLENLRAMLLPMLEEKKLELKIEIDPGLKRICVDPFKFEQVFINLVENSLRYTDSGTISIQARCESNLIIFIFADTGAGIEAIHLPRIFERFYVADPSRNKASGGAGLGLAIVKHIILLHQGNIAVESTQGRGTSFIITLPRLHAPED